MKKCIRFSLITLLLLNLLPLSSSAATPIDPISVAGTHAPVSMNANDLMLRLAEIKSTDKSGLSASEKKQLRKEKRAIKSELRAVKGGVYVSLGALLVIVLILIILL